MIMGFSLNIWGGGGWWFREDSWRIMEEIVTVECSMICRNEEWNQDQKLLEV